MIMSARALYARNADAVVRDRSFLLISSMSQEAERCSFSSIALKRNSASGIGVECALHGKKKIPHDTSMRFVAHNRGTFP